MKEQREFKLWRRPEATSSLQAAFKTIEEDEGEEAATSCKQPWLLRELISVDAATVSVFISAEQHFCQTKTTAREILGGRVSTSLPAASWQEFC